MKIGEHVLDLASLQELVDSLPALIHTGRPDGYLDFFNRRWLHFVGLRLEDLEGWKWTAAIHPDDVTALVANWRACLESGRPLEIEARVRRADGVYCWMLHQKQPLRNAEGQIVRWYGSSVDIDDRKRAEFKIDEQQSAIRQILDLTPQHVYVFGPDTSLAYANQVALEYFGVGLQQIQADSRINFVHPDDRERFLAEREKGAFEETPHEFEIRLLRHDGKFRWFLVRRKST